MPLRAQRAPSRENCQSDRKRRLSTEPITTGDDGEHPPTLIESEIQTLYAGFQQGRSNSKTEEEGTDIERDLEWQELEERSRKLKKEESKVRSLNANGRVDYSIQEGVSTMLSSPIFTPQLTSRLQNRY